MEDVGRRGGNNKAKRRGDENRGEGKNNYRSKKGRTELRGGMEGEKKMEGDRVRRRRGK